MLEILDWRDTNERETEREREREREGERKGERLDSNRERDNVGVERAYTVSGGETVERGERVRERVT